MQLVQLRICNFQSFGPDPEDVKLDPLTYVLGPNGAGKTAVLQALVRLFGVDPSQRRVQPSDFHIPVTAPESVESLDSDQELWVEAEFEIPEASDESGETHSTVPSFYGHMQLECDDNIPRLRVRLTATLDLNGFVDEKIVCVVEAEENGEPKRCVDLPRDDRNLIQVHYLPARRDPADHISYAASSLLGRALRAVDWSAERDKISTLTTQLSAALVENNAVEDIGVSLQKSWSDLHSGTYFENPSISFGRGDVENLLRYLTLTFSPSPTNVPIDFGRLSDGQKSLLYISLVLALQSVGRDVQTGSSTAFDVDKLRPAAFTVIAVEEPENSLSPQYLGRIVKALRTASERSDVQALIATHSPALMRRVPPEHVRFLRLNEKRVTRVREIIMPPKQVDGYKFVREAIQAFPELYFARLVVLGEGDSEELVLPRLLAARGVAEDDASVVVAPLGGRHVNHFWRLLHGLEIPHITLLDLDFARFGGGWGRISNAVKYLNLFSSSVKDQEQFSQEKVGKIPKWNSSTMPKDPIVKPGSWRAHLEREGVFFSTPVDLDLMMLEHYSDAYGIDAAASLTQPDASTCKAVLGAKRENEEFLGEDLLGLFSRYHRLFKLESKPAAHLEALSKLSDEELVDGMPPVLDRMITEVSRKLKAIPE